MLMPCQNIVLEPPSFLYSPPAYTTGRKGQSIFLRCEATGTPTPTLEWFKDGVKIVSSDRVTVTEDDLQVGYCSYF